MVDSEPPLLGGKYLEGHTFVLTNTGTLFFTSVVDLDGDGNPDDQGIFSVKASVS